MIRRFLMAALLMTAGLFSAIAMPVNAADKEHKVSFHIDENDAGRMNLVLNNAQNVNNYYSEKGEKVQIEIVAYGPGLEMLVADKSPVKARVSSMSMAMDYVQFSACSNTHKAMSKKAGKEIKLLEEAKMVPSGVIRLIELQESGWSYIRP